VVNVIWEDAKAFCEHYGYSLPTEAQWEYAARAGTTTHWSSGNAEQQLGQYAWFLGNSGNRVQPVGGKLPNPLGLYDMHGNAWEWVTDCYDGGAYTHRKELTVDPLETGGRCLLRVLRGGAFWREARILRSADRYRVVPGFWVDDRGFRCVRGPRRRP
jgi:formylglycine-generating enzyme required for sulfatase activity